MKVLERRKNRSTKPRLHSTARHGKKQERLVKKQAAITIGKTNSKPSAACVFSQTVKAELTYPVRWRDETH
jgi:hypothetical protein